MNKKTLMFFGAFTCCAFAILNSAFAQNTAFTYQGKLETNGVPYSGSAEFEFVLWDAFSGGSAVATNNPVSVITSVNSGLFTVALDFGSVPFTGDARFLETDIRTGTGPFTPLSPRQPLTPAPYALYALNTTPNLTRDLEIQNTNDVELSLKSADAGGHLWTLQSSAVNGSANLDGTFQIIDHTSGDTRLLIATNGNVGIGTSDPTNRLHVNGGITCTALVQTSDRNAKENFAPVSPENVLAKVAALPISTWNFKEMRDGRHLGPMAQDFYAAFGLGGSKTTITAVDTEGVALAAIQGLNEKLQEDSQAKDEEIRELNVRLKKLETLMESRGRK